MPGLIGPIWWHAAQWAPPALRLMLRRRVGRGKEWAARLPEREGIDPAPRPPGRLIWIHAASVGESVSVLPVLPYLRDVTVLITTGTVTSATVVAERLPGLVGIGTVLHRFVPLDVPAWVARFLDHWRPDLAAFVESELWPNTLAACQARRSTRACRNEAPDSGGGHPALPATSWARSTGCRRSRRRMRRGWSGSARTA